MNIKSEGFSGFPTVILKATIGKSKSVALARGASRIGILLAMGHVNSYVGSIPKKAE